MSVNVDGSVEVSDILADREDGRVDITAGGDVKQEQDTAIHGDSLNIDAGGDVDVNVHVGENEKAVLDFQTVEQDSPDPALAASAAEMLEAIEQVSAQTTGE